MKALTISTVLKTDVLVLGGGLAGLKAANVAARECHVILAAAGGLCSGASFYPLMDTLGCQCTAETDRDKDDFLAEINDSSLGMNDTFMCQYYIDHIRRRVEELPELGIQPQRIKDGKIACFAQRPRDIFYWGGWDTIREKNRTALSENPRITTLEHTTALCLLKKDNVVAGAVLASADNTLYVVTCGAVVLATGGYGNLFQHNLNTPDVCGSGQAMALLAGASLVNLEFAQFIPGFISPAYKTILREGTLAHCAGLFNSMGEDVLRQELPEQAEYQKCLRQRMTHGPFTFEGISKHFDIALFRATVANPGEEIQIRYRDSLLQDGHEVVKVHLAWLKNQMHVDILRDKITIAPFFHAANGGILVGHDCGTEVPGLYAAGEAAGGIHGADRHGGNASGSCLVFGALAGEQAAAHATCSNPSADIKLASQHLDELLSPHTGAGELTPEAVMQQVRIILWENANVVRNGPRLETALAKIRQLEAEYAPGKYARKLTQAVKAKHFLILSKAILTAVLARKESRGSHYREDHPYRDDANFRRPVSRKLA